LWLSLARRKSRCCTCASNAATCSEQLRDLTILGSIIRFELSDAFLISHVLILP